MHDIKKKIGFVYFSSLAHIYHSAAIACEMSKNENFEVTILVSSQIVLKNLKKIMLAYCPDHTCRFKFLYPSKWYTLKTALHLNKQGLFPKISKVEKHNANFLMSFDALVATDYSLRHLMRKDVHRRVKYICTFHGAGDRAHGFTQRRKDFDFLLISGQSSWDRLCKNNILNGTNAKIVGYSKFDLVLNKKSKSEKLFNNDNLTFVFNPHFKEKLGSWNHWGSKVLEYFYLNPGYNLIFAPHVLLFNKKKNPILKKYYTAPNILIDYNSEALMNMTYTIHSDIYIGEVSSQIYEFLHKPRPCIFLNPHGISWKGEPSFRMWDLGDVVDDFSQFDTAVQNAVKHHPLYIKKQIEYVGNKFSKSHIPASKRAAQAIADFLKDPQPMACPRQK